MEDQRILRIELALEVSMPQTESLFQGLVLAFWRFQGMAATELFRATLKSIEDRLWMNLMVAQPGGGGVSDAGVGRLVQQPAPARAHRKHSSNGTRNGILSVSRGPGRGGWTQLKQSPV